MGGAPLGTMGNNIWPIRIDQIGNWPSLKRFSQKMVLDNIVGFPYMYASADPVQEWGGFFYFFKCNSSERGL